MKKLLSHNICLFEYPYLIVFLPCVLCEALYPRGVCVCVCVWGGGGGGTLICSYIRRL